MSVVADALQPMLIPGLIALEGRLKASSLGDLIGRQSKIGFFLSFNNMDNAIELDFRDSEPVTQSFAHDSSRFASSAFQSIIYAMHGLSDKENFAWSIIKTYYAAFYAGHSLIRMLGESCTYFGASQVGRIVALAQAQATPPAFKLSATTYHCRTQTQAPAKIHAKSLREGSGGAHEAFWAVFGQVISRVGEAVLHGSLTEREAQSVFAKIETARFTLTSRGSPHHSWLSVVRNDVQYKHGYNAWMPCGVNKNDRESLQRILEQWRRDPMMVDVGVYDTKPLHDFCACCAFVVALCRQMLERVADRSPKRARSFAYVGPLSIIPRAAPLNA